MKINILIRCILLCVFPLTCNAQKDFSSEGHIGTIVQTYTTSRPVNSISGMAFHETSAGNYLYLLDGSTGRILRYRENFSDFSLTFSDEIQPGVKLNNPRGLAIRDNILYLLDYKSEGPISNLIKYDLNTKKVTTIDLTNKDFGIGNREVFDVELQDNSVLICFNPSGIQPQEERVMKGIVSISNDDKPHFIKHTPGPGKPLNGDKVEPSRSLAGMTFGGTGYLWGTVGRDYIYLLDGITGRGIFFFEKPGSAVKVPYNDAMTFGDEYLWVAEQKEGADLIHRINVIHNLKEPYAGPKRLRKIRMGLTANVEKNVTNPKGLIYQAYCYPYSERIIGRQGVMLNSVDARSLTDANNTKIEHLSFHPAGDKNNQQDYTLVTYQPEQNPGIKSYRSEFTLNTWTREYKQFVYPHLTNRNSKPDGDYLEDDTVLYKMKEGKDIYSGFITRVRNYVHSLYNMEPDMDNPYWAARNIKEYVHEHYHYPNDAAGYWANYDFRQGSFNSHPGNIKAGLSADNNFEDNIIACSATSMMSNGIYRSLGLPARWGGMSQEQAWQKWEKPKNGELDEFLQKGEESEVTNGHRVNQVWMGDFYGWQVWDNTPKIPSDDAFKSKPEKWSQWDLMQKSAAGVAGVRHIHNLQSEYWPYLMVALEDGKSINNSGAYRYNLMGTYTNPEDYEMSKQMIKYSALQYIDNISVAIDENKKAMISWQKGGLWGFDPDAALRIVLEKQVERKDSVQVTYRVVRVLSESLPYSLNSLTADFSGITPGKYRVAVHKVGDVPTGNATIIEIRK